MSQNTYLYWQKDDTVGYRTWQSFIMCSIDAFHKEDRCVIAMSETFVFKVHLPFKVYSNLDLIFLLF